MMARFLSANHSPRAYASQKGNSSMSNTTHREELDRLLQTFDECIGPMARYAEPCHVDVDMVPAPGSEGTRSPSPTSTPSVGPLEGARPRVSRDLMRSLQAIHYGLSKATSASLSELLQSTVRVQLTRMESTTFGAFAETLGSPCCCHVLNPFPLDGHWILDLQPAILYPLIDRMLGVKSPVEVEPQRPLSGIELRLASRLAALFMQDLQMAWSRAIPLDLQIAYVESQPQELQCLTAYEPVLRIGFEVAIGNHIGAVQWCIPTTSIARFEPALGVAAMSVDTSAAQWDGTLDRLADPWNRNEEVEVVVTLARSTIESTALANLEVGDIISFETDIHELLEVEANQELRFRASPGAHQGRKAIQIERIEPAPTEGPIEIATDGQE
jgi:flagellar motor switch protein FliM